MNAGATAEPISGMFPFNWTAKTFAVGGKYVPQAIGRSNAASTRGYGAGRKRRPPRQHTEHENFEPRHPPGLPDGTRFRRRQFLERARAFFRATQT